MWIQKTLIAGAAFVALALSTHQAKADHACRVTYIPGSSTAGADGYVYFTVYTGASCTGTLVGNFNLCTGGSTSSSCSSSYRYSLSSILAVFAALQQAASLNQRISVQQGTCNGGASGCASYPNFWSN